jgi:hypothetical protein
MAENDIEKMSIGKKYSASYVYGFGRAGEFKYLSLSRARFNTFFYSFTPKY